MNTSSTLSGQESSSELLAQVIGNRFTTKNQLIEQVCQELNFSLDSIINLYLVGSRLYNCHDQNSDYDMIMIVKDDCTLPPFDNVNWVETESDKILLESQRDIIQNDTIPNRNENCVSYRSDLLDINIYRERQFKFELKYFLDQSLFEIASLSYYNDISVENQIQIHNLERVQNCILIENQKYFITNIKSDIEKSSFRSPFSRKSSNSYIKSKKKLCVEHDLKVGLKSMFHSMKILMFAIQILSFGFVNNFEEANPYYEHIMMCSHHDQNTDEPSQSQSTNEEYDYETIWTLLDTKYKTVKKELERKFHLLAPKIGKPNKKK